MKVLLVRPPHLYFEDSSFPAVDLPLGLLYIAASLEKNGVDVDVFDSLIYQDNPLKLKQRYGVVTGGGAAFGASLGRIEDTVLQLKPSVVGISNMFTAQSATAIQTARVIKKLDKNVTVLLGGAHPSVAYRQILADCREIDAVVIGEGESCVNEIISRLTKKTGFEGIAGVAYRKGQEIIFNPPEVLHDLDALPLPAYHKVDLERYFELNKIFASRPRYKYPFSERAVTMITSRGCPFHCAFCSVHLHMGRKWRSHTPDYVLRHIEYLVENYRIKHIHFEDDNLSLDPSRFEALLDNLTKKKLKVSWDTPNGIHLGNLDRRIIEKARDSGCAYLTIAIESGDENVLNRLIKKNIRLESAVAVARLCQDAGLDLEAFFLIGMPGETIKDMLKTIGFAIALEKEHGLHPLLFKVTPLLGTEVYEVCKNHGYFTREENAQSYSQATSGSSMIETEDFSPADIDRLKGSFLRKHKRVYYSNFIKFILKNPAVLVNLFACPNGMGFLERVKNTMRYKNCARRKIGSVNVYEIQKSLIN